MDDGVDARRVIITTCSFTINYFAFNSLLELANGGSRQLLTSSLKDLSVTLRKRKLKHQYYPGGKSSTTTTATWVAMDVSL